MFIGCLKLVYTRQTSFMVPKLLKIPTPRNGKICKRLHQIGIKESIGSVISGLCDP
jgi:hypothetical protein